MRIAILGATGAVGQEMIRILEQRTGWAGAAQSQADAGPASLRIGELRLLASPRSAGRTMTFCGNALPVQAVP